jgi:hypothetical protein
MWQVGGERQAHMSMKENVKGRGHVEDLGKDARITLNKFSTESTEGHTLDSSDQGQVVGFCEYSNELLGSKKCGEPLD